MQEVERTYRYRLDICEIEACIREAVINEHEIALDTIVLVGPGTIPKTTSGKIQRARTRRMWLQGSFESLDAAWSRSPFTLCVSAGVPNRAASCCVGQLVMAPLAAGVVASPGPS